MVRMAMSPAASGLLRALIVRAGVQRDRILLTHLLSIDWQSLTFIGERHQITLRILEPNSDAAARRLTSDLEGAEFMIPGQIVADIALSSGPERTGDGSTQLTIEALTIAE
jgi:hypothetical protein